MQVISAVLVVCDEADRIGPTLDSLAAVVDEVIVYDAGSVDGTAHLAATAGARVLPGHWDDDHARARNDAGSAARGEWVLMLRAGERLVADRDALRALLAGPEADGYRVRLESPLTEVEDRWVARLARRGTRWRENGEPGEAAPVDRHGQPVPLRSLPPSLGALHEHSAEDPLLARARAESTAHQAQTYLDTLVGRPQVEPGVAAEVLLVLGRSLIAAERRQDAVETFALVRDLVPGTGIWREATDHLARILLGIGDNEQVLQLCDELVAAGADQRYCDWLRAQALAQMGRPERALELIRTVDELIDPAGRRYDLGPVLEVRALLAAMLGRHDEAVSSLTRAMVRHGRVRGRGELLVQLWGDAPAVGLATIVRQAGTFHLSSVVEELKATGGRGREAAHALVG